MRDARSSEKWLREFEQFMAAEPIVPPAGVTERVFTKVKADLNPPTWKVFFKLGAIHSVVGSLTLLVCPQFGMGPRLGLMTYLMKLGPQVCTIGCGMLFLGISALVSAFFLRMEDIRVLRKTALLQLSILGLASIGVFRGFGAVVVMDVALLWILGSVPGGFGSLELGWLIRAKLSNRPSLSM
jgi:hypothetical protein